MSLPMNTEGFDSFDGSNFSVTFFIVVILLVALFLCIVLIPYRRRRDSEDPWHTNNSSTEGSVGDDKQDDFDEDEDEWSPEDEDFFRRSLDFLVQEGSVTALDLVDEDESEVHRLTDTLTLCVILYDEYVFVVVEQDGVMHFAETNIVGY